MNKFTFLRAYFSPFKPLRVHFYIGKVSVGTPYFLPRRWVRNKEKKGYSIAVPKYIGFDFVSLGWKTKWTKTDYRFEWSPIWSFVFFRWQIALIFEAPHRDHYWECWLYYYHNTNKSKSTRERVEQCMKEFPCIWTSHEKGETTTINYYDKILKKKFLQKKSLTLKNPVL